MKKRVIYAADLFCGAGGFSSGLLYAAEELGFEVELVAINHWEIAIQTHAANHANVRHLCQTIETVNPREVVPGGYLDLLMASPECTHHSNARGGKPMNEQSRATTWCILRWLEKLDVENLIIENVPEFQSWGPLYPEDHPDPKKRNRPIEREKGKYFRNFIRNLRCFGYRVDWRVLNAADYGAATTRKRFFLLARKGRKPIAWPEPTHFRPNGVRHQGLFVDDRKPWRPAREIIDWEIPGESIYERKRPLAENTRARIFAGLKKFSGLPFLVPNFGERDGQAPRAHSVEDPLPTVTSHGAGALCEPFLVVLRNNCDGRSLDEPVPALAANGNHVGLAEPFILPHQHGADGMDNVRGIDLPLPTVTGTSADIFLAQPYLVNMKGRSDASDVEKPAPTITAHAPHLAVVEPFIVPQFSEAEPKSVGDPLGCITTTSRGVGLVQPFLLPNEGYYRGNAPRSADEPLPTVTQNGAGGLVEAEVKPFVIGQQSGAVARSVEEPIPTVAGAGAISLVEAEVKPLDPFVMQMEHSGNGHNGHGHRCYEAERPLPTIAGKGMLGLVEPYLVAVNHGPDARTQPLEQPLPTLTGKGTLGLVEPYLVEYHGGEGAEERSQSVDVPLPTQTTANRFGLVQPFLVRFNSSDRQMQSVEQPLGAVDCKDRFALVQPEVIRSPEFRGEIIGQVIGYLDIRFRMLQPHELAAAMGFPPHYEFAGNREAKVKQIGNAVEVHQAKALCGAVLRNLKGAA